MRLFAKRALTFHHPGQVGFDGRSEITIAASTSAQTLPDWVGECRTYLEAEKSGLAFRLPDEPVASVAPPSLTPTLDGLIAAGLSRQQAEAVLVKRAALIRSNSVTPPGPTVESLMAVGLTEEEAISAIGSKIPVLITPQPPKEAEPDRSGLQAETVDVPAEHHHRPEPEPPLLHKGGGKRR